MTKPILRFDQLFEKLPSGKYREREKPVAINWRNSIQFYRSPKTGKICVARQELNISSNHCIPHGYRLMTFLEFYELQRTRHGLLDIVDKVHSFGNNRFEYVKQTILGARLAGPELLDDL